MQCGQAFTLGQHFFVMLSLKMLNLHCMYMYIYVLPTDDFPSSSEILDPPSSPDVLSDPTELSPETEVFPTSPTAEHSESPGSQEKCKCAYACAYACIRTCTSTVLLYSSAKLQFNYHTRVTPV